MNKSNSIEFNSIKNNSLETIDKAVLSEQAKFKPNKLNNWN